MTTRKVKLSKDNAYGFMEEGLRRYKTLKDNEFVRGIKETKSGYELIIRTRSTIYDDLTCDVEPSNA